MRVDEYKPLRDDRGGVYIEFLLAFPPLFLLFLAICQLSLLAAAKLVVQHAATRAARAAIVVLEDDPKYYGDAPRGDLSHGMDQPNTSLFDVLLGLKLVESSPSSPESWLPLATAATTQSSPAQRGARMRPIRNAAYMPLLTLAPRTFTSQSDDSLGAALRNADFAHSIVASVAYTRAASVVTLQQAPGSLELANEPIPPNAPVTVRVTYFYRCSVPVVRALVCRSMQKLLKESLLQWQPGKPLQDLKQRYEHAESPGWITGLAFGTYFAVLEGEATLPNQGAPYYAASTSKKAGEK